MAGRLRTVASVALISILPALVLTSSAAPQKQSPGPGFDWPWAVSYQDLISDPAASLFYPRSEILQEGGWQEFAELCHGAALMCSPGDVPAFVETQLAVDGLEPQEIFLWYDTELTAMGWRPEASTDNIHTARYAKGEDSQFVLFVDDLPTSQELIGGPDSVLFYSIRYSKGTCPSIDAGCRSHLVPAISDFRRDATMPSSARINFEDLDSRSDAHLFYPGSSLMGSNGYGEGSGHLVGFDDPFLRSDLVSPSTTTTQLVAWYEAELAARGYDPVKSSDPQVRAYRRGLDVFSVIVSGGDPSRGPYGVSGVMYVVIYAIDTCDGHHPPICRQ